MNEIGGLSAITIVGGLGTIRDLGGLAKVHVGRPTITPVLGNVVVVNNVL